VLEYLVWHGLREIELILQGCNSIDAHDRSLRETPAQYRKIMDQMEQFFLDQAQKHKCLGFPWLTIDDIAAETLDRCKAGDYSALALDWNLLIWDYQKFITYACGLNTAMKAMLEIPANFSPEAIQAAIALRIDMIQHYDAPLTREGEKALKIATFAQLMDPPETWFVSFVGEENDPRRNNLNKVFLGKDNITVLLTSGCSTQCDHCSEANCIMVRSMPWIWFMQLQQGALAQTLKFNVMTRTDVVKDYYDLIYDKDAGDMKFITKWTSSGFAPGSVGARASRKIAYNCTISLAANIWMRNLGCYRYLEAIRQIKKSIKLADLDYCSFYRKGDPKWLRVIEFEEFFSLNDVGLNPQFVNCEGRAFQLTQTGIELEGLRSTIEFVSEDEMRLIILPNGSVIRGLELTKEARTKWFKHRRQNLRLPRPR
ncbi:MAG: hypothetical protein NTY47_06530, partial [Candidatus Omnitrophica bacterium]|nr:hypothetical protein [Candidatus Omnitrophota bacterium]